MRRASDDALVAGYRRGDLRAFDELIARYEKPVYRACYRYFRNAADAEDAAQETFIRLIRSVAAYRGGDRFWAWLHRIAVNTCHDLARKRSRRPERAWDDVAGEHSSEHLGEPVASAEDTVVGRSLREDLLSGLDRLGEGTRAAVILHDVYGVPHAEIAATIGVAVGTVKSRIHRGRAFLASRLTAA